MSAISEAQVAVYDVLSGITALKSVSFGYEPAPSAGFPRASFYLSSNDGRTFGGVLSKLRLQVNIFSDDPSSLPVEALQDAVIAALDGVKLTLASKRATPCRLTSHNVTKTMSGRWQAIAFFEFEII